MKSESSQSITCKEKVRHFAVYLKLIHSRYGLYIMQQKVQKLDVKCTALYII